MQCSRCGAANQPNAVQCAMCGVPLQAGAGGANPFADRGPGVGPNPYLTPQTYPPPGSSIGDDVAMRLVIPVGTSGWAIASGYCGLLSLICPLGFLGVFGIITGVLAFKEIKKKPKLGGKVRAIIGIVLGAIGTVGFVFFVIGMIGIAMDGRK